MQPRHQHQAGSAHSHNDDRRNHADQPPPPDPALGPGHQAGRVEDGRRNRSPLPQHITQQF
jgi:hypothetical protein